MTAHNKAIQRIRHIKPTLAEVLTDLNVATTFSAIDLNKGYHHVKLHKSSRLIITWFLLEWDCNATNDYSLVAMLNILRLYSPISGGSRGIINASDEISV